MMSGPMALDSRPEPVGERGAQRPGAGVEHLRGVGVGDGRVAAFEEVHQETEGDDHDRVERQPVEQTAERDDGAEDDQSHFRSKRSVTRAARKQPSGAPTVVRAT